MIFVRTQILHVSHANVRVRLQKVIARGKRVVKRQGVKEDHGAWGCWYNAATMAAAAIYPTPTEQDLLHRAQERSGSLSERTQAVVDQLEDFLDTIGSYNQAPAQARIVAFLREQKGLWRFFNVAGYAVAYIVGEYREELFTLVRGLL